MTRHEIRRRAEDLIHELIEFLDQFDGNPDDEIETDLDINPITLQSADRRPAKRIRKAA